MIDYVALLRGVNVSGKNKIQMKEFVEYLKDLRFDCIRSYIQSGNILFRFEDINEEILEMGIVELIQKKYNYDIKTLVIRKSDLQFIIENNPFKDIDYKNLHISILKQIPDYSLQSKLEAIDFSPDKFNIINNYIYLNCPNGYGRTKLTNNYFESKLKVDATTRNWNTITKLYGMI